MRPSESHFQEQVARWTRDAILDGVNSFDRLLTSLPGVYPSLVVHTIEKLQNELPLNAPVLQQILAEAATPWNGPPIQDSISRFLPIPHPLDFEWRFCPNTLDYLRVEAERLSCPGHSIALIGTPTVLLDLDRSLGDRCFILLDKNRLTAERIAGSLQRGQVKVFDAFTNDPPLINATVTFIDPPWYTPYFEVFLWSASKITCMGGTVLLSLPAVGTRPCIDEERICLLQRAEYFGFELVELRPAELGYLSPLFEQNALRAEGIIGCPPVWRFADLAVFVLTSQKEVGRPQFRCRKNEWEEHMIKDVRIRVRTSRRSSGINSPGLDPTLKSIVASDIMPSVSTRDPRRKMVHVWTSGNRVFRCDSSEVLSILLEHRSCSSIGNRLCIIQETVNRQLSASEKHNIHVAASQIDQLVTIEQEEITRS